MTTYASETGAHPDDLEGLLDRARLGGPTDAAERRRLQEHLAVCHICTLQVRNAAVADQPEYVSAADAHLDRIAMHRVLLNLPRAPRRRRFPLSRRWARVVMATLLVSGTAAAASWWSAREGLSLFSLRRGGTSVADQGSPAATRVGQPTFQAQPAVANPLAPSVAFVEADDPTVLPPAPHESDAMRGQSATAGAGDGDRGSSNGKTMSAAQLFDRARKLRVGGDFAGARATYRHLQHSYPTSRETHFSYLILGRMFLEGGRPEQGARQFALYLSGGGGASEEALVGHATASALLGRGKDEAADWQTLLAQHPASVYAGKARARLAELGELPSAARSR